MTEPVVPHFHNDIGVAEIEIGATEFMCIGAMPPFIIRMYSATWVMMPNTSVPIVRRFTATESGAQAQ